MSVFKGCIIAALALAAGAWVEKAHADEAFVCDAGRIVYVKPGELEAKKLQDPCIASYFETVPSAKPSAATAARQSVGDAAPTPTTSVTAKSHVAERSEPVSDYRNVHIINAAPGAEAWFKHRR